MLPYEFALAVVITSLIFEIKLPLPSFRYKKFRCPWSLVTYKSKSASLSTSIQLQPWLDPLSVTILPVVIFVKLFPPSVDL